RLHRPDAGVQWLPRRRLDGAKLLLDLAFLVEEPAHGKDCVDGNLPAEAQDEVDLLLCSWQCSLDAGCPVALDEVLGQAKGDLITGGAIGLGYSRKGRAAEALHAQKSVGECLLHLARNLFGCKVSEGESTGNSPLVRPCSDIEDAIVGAVEADGAQQLHRASSPDSTLMIAELSGSALAGPSSGRMMRPPSSSRPST